MSIYTPPPPEPPAIVHLTERESRSGNVPDLPLRARIRPGEDPKKPPKAATVSPVPAANIAGGTIMPRVRRDLLGVLPRDFNQQPPIVHHRTEVAGGAVIASPSASEVAELRALAWDIGEQIAALIAPGETLQTVLEERRDPDRDAGRDAIIIGLHEELMSIARVSPAIARYIRQRVLKSTVESPVKQRFRQLVEEMQAAFALAESTDYRVLRREKIRSRQRAEELQAEVEALAKQYGGVEKLACELGLCGSEQRVKKTEARERFEGRKSLRSIAKLGFVRRSWRWGDEDAARRQQRRMKRCIGSHPNLFDRAGRTGKKEAKEGRWEIRRFLSDMEVVRERIAQMEDARELAEVVDAEMERLHEELIAEFIPDDGAETAKGAKPDDGIGGVAIRAGWGEGELESLREKRERELGNDHRYDEDAGKRYGQWLKEVVARQKGAGPDIALLSSTDPSPGDASQQAV